MKHGSEKACFLPEAVPGAGGLHPVLRGAVRAGPGDAGPRLQRAGKHHPHPAAQTDGRVGGWAEQLFYELYQICEGSGLRAGPVDQPAEPGRDDPVPEDPERRYPAGAGAPDVCPALPRSAHRRAGLEQESGSCAVAGRALPRQGELHARAVGLSALPGRPAPRCAPDGRGRADRRSAGSAPGGAVSPRHRCAAGAQGRVSVLSHRPPLDDAGGLLRLRAVLRSAGPDAL